MDRRVCMPGLFLCNRKFLGISCYIKNGQISSSARFFFCDRPNSAPPFPYITDNNVLFLSGGLHDHRAQ